MRAATLAGTALAAAAGLLLCFALTRIYAFLYPASTVYLLTTFGAGGAAAGALLAHRLGWLPSRARTLAAAAGAAGLAVVLTLASAAAGAPINVALLDLLLCFLTYAALGLPLAAAYQVLPRHPAAVFGAQLLGAGLAAAAALPVLDTLGPLRTGLAAAALAGAGGIVHGAAALARPVSPPAGDPGVSRSRWPVPFMLAGAFAIAALLLDSVVPWLRIDPQRVGSDKSLFVSLQDEQAPERLVYSAWSSQGRVDISATTAGQDVRWIYLDGSVAGVLHPASGGEAAAAALKGDAGYLPYTLPGAHDRVLVAGATAGEDTLFALAAGAREIVVAEPNPALLAAIRASAAYAGDLLAQPGVRVVAQDARTFLRASGEQFDVIYVPLPGAEVVQPGNVLPRGEAYTLEAMSDYLDHLRQDGRVVLRLRDRAELTRGFNTAFQALLRRGANPLDAIRRLVAWNDDPLAQRSGSGGEVALPVLLVRKTPFLQDEAQAAAATIGQSPFTALFLPYQEEQSPLGLGIFAAEGYGPAAVEAATPFDSRPTTDSSPFFFELGKGFPVSLIFAALVLAALVGAAAFFTRRPDADTLELDEDLPPESTTFLEDEVPWRFLGFAALLGAGFVLVGLPPAQRLPLFLGQPPLAVALSAATLLLGGVAGCVLVALTPAASLRHVIGWAGLFAGLFAIALLELLPLTTFAFRAQSGAVRAAVAAVLLLPEGVCLGVPFPAAVRLLAAARRGLWAPALWAAATLAAAGAAFISLALGMAWSFGYSLGLGALCLLAAFLIAGLRWLTVPAGPEPSAGTPATDHSLFQRREPASEQAPSLAGKGGGAGP